jgi:copper chaperone CopZ
VSFEEQAARVTYDSDQVSVEQMVEAVSRAGFRASAPAGG